ncbi:cation ABC transporter substrate-binding protein [Alicyclobacillaceae bacterium I2511]|nr:cation ABC transporter substrate-binding protein [Alicyclobacillaceae bacterium I2511]
MQRWRNALFGVGLSLFGVVLTGCGSPAGTPAAGGPSTSGMITAVGAENEYGNLISQIGGKAVSVQSIMTNPNVDPHTYEADTANARFVSAAQLIVQNGIGYDSFMNHLESASPVKGRIVVTVANVLGYGPNTPNPHLWYNPSTMPRLAPIVAADLSKLDPQEHTYFEQNASHFIQSLQPWTQAVQRVHSEFPGAPVAVTEPVADYLLQACGLSIRTPWAFQAAIMNGVDPSPQDVAVEENLLKQRQVKLFVYNQQAVDATTSSLLGIARANHIPVVGVYETMPPDYSYQSWMVTETNAFYNALKNHSSMVTLH